ncbi:MAG: cryptochrome/photolyase family protein [Planctomycetota bacterium]
MPKTKCALWWVRCDLRLEDNPALHRALADGGPVLPLYVVEPQAGARCVRGEASRWWLGHSLQCLAKSLHAVGSRLLVMNGEPHSIIRDIAGTLQLTSVCCNASYDPDSLIRQSHVRDVCRELDITMEVLDGNVFTQPGTLRTLTGSPLRVFTPFWKRLVPLIDNRTVLAAPRHVPAPEPWPDLNTINPIDIQPRHRWTDKLAEHWQTGEQAAMNRLETFFPAVGAYAKQRDIPSDPGTSRLAPHLHFGEISPVTVIDRLRRSWKDPVAAHENSTAFVRQLAWREFARHLLVSFPETISQPLRPEFFEFPWEDREEHLCRWQRGQTGYPIVDAGMRELWQTGWMHNRVRMITASFLTKHLLINWEHGASWFLDTLVDADPANNTLGWQWVAGCGADAAPYFRIFNPTVQGERFDPLGKYVRRWIPSLQRLDRKWIHRPWEAPASALAEAGVTLGRDYPDPIIDHKEARQRALSAYDTVRRAGTSNRTAP